MASKIIASSESSAEDGSPVGPYSPIGGPNSITFCGSLLALAKSHQVNTAGIADGNYSKVYEAKDSEGHTWFVRWIGDPLFFAFRDRTAQEIEDEDDRVENLYGVHFQRMRLDACRLVAYALGELAETMRPDQCPSRQRRRSIKRRMLALAALQQNLLSLTAINARALREEMSSLGLALPRRNHLGV